MIESYTFINPKTISMKKELFLFSGILAFSFFADAQELKYDYMKWPDSQKLGEYVNSWTPGTELFEDENFYISRVKPKERFRNAATQIDETLTEANDKQLVFWVPIGNVTNANDQYFTDNGRPNGKFDAEAFSMWSYLTHYGNWTAPQGWVPGSFADAAHKNGVGVSGVASVPWGGLGSDWNNALTTLANADPEKVAKFLRYHGVDGLGYNSEFSGGSSFLPKLRTLHETIYRYLTENGNPVAENFWYDGTNDNGQITFDQGLGNHNKETFGDGDHIRTSLFLNYNWWGTTPRNSFGKVQTYAPGRSSLDLYAGFNMQGGDPSTWTLLKDYDISIGLWGAHDYNMLWADRANNGSTDIAKQLNYQNIIEQFFSNGNRNPIDKIEVYDRKNHHPDEKWFGMSAFMTARSSLKWNLSEEPFITYFNLGNGRFFNWMGERQNDREWYNIGVQDYLPTWRYWFASEFLGKTADKVVENGLDAKFTYDDAYVGGSCLRIFGSVANEYLHMFKTDFTLDAGDVITVRYKLVRGQADINLVLSAVGAETEPLRESGFKVLTVADSEADDEIWIEKQFTISGSLASLANQDIAMIALHFQNAENLELYLGEFSITRSDMSTPATPEIKLAKVLASHYKGVDAKLIFNMPNSKPAGEPVYNLDVNTSLFKLYAQQEGGEPILMGITTSWAGMYYSIPTDLDGTQRIRLGVAAVSLDMKSDSEIAWSEYQDMGEYTMTNDIQIDKTTIKPNEGFEISYVDPRHPAADWKLLNSDGETVKHAENTSVFSVPEGIEEIGGYDLQVIYEGETTTYGYYVQVTSEEVGALPEIYTLTVDGEDTENAEVKIEVDQELTLGYTGRKANGASSRGIEINEGWVGGPMSDLGIGGGKTFSVSAWVRFTSIPGSSCFFSVENRASSAWPVNNWGWMWANINPAGKLANYTFRSSTANGSPELKYVFPNTTITPNAWNHVVLVFEYNTSSQFRSKFYLNGVLQESTWTFNNASGTTEDWVNINYSISASDWFCFAGGRGSEPVYNNGIIDDLLVWDGAMTLEEVQAAKEGLDAESLPSDVIAYWDFETDANDDNYFIAKGSKSEAKACSFKTEAGEGEGSGVQVPQNPLYISGCPFIAGTTFKVETLPTWTAKRGVLSESSGTDTEGSTKLTYSKPGDYTVTLKLENSLGSDTKTYPVFTIDEEDGVETGAMGEMRTYTVEDVLFVEFAEEGTYQVGVYNISGMLVAQEEADVVAGQHMSITLGSKGVYVVKVMKEGKVVRAVKVMNR